MKRPPHEGPEFEHLMGAIDIKLTKDGVEIQSRPIFAVREVALQFNLSIPIGTPSAHAPADLRENAVIGEAIHRWYEDNYGDRLKENPSPGSIVVLLDGDLYVLQVPRIFGSVEFVITRDWSTNPRAGISRNLMPVNVAQLVQDMTARKLARLSDDALSTIARAFETVLPAAYTLESTNHKLMYHARGDVRVAVSNLMERDGRYGESKWASLQAAEKTLKTAISIAGAKYGRTHDLDELCRKLADTGMKFDASCQIAAIQCSPRIRYGDEQCSRDDALAAHHASLELVNILRDAGAGFEPGIGR